jgi:predicted permease
MRILARARAIYRSLLRRKQVERDLDDELRSALQELTERYESRGLAPDAARRAAQLDLGHIDVIKEEVRSRGFAHTLDTTWQDIRQGFRGLVRTPAVGAVIVLIFAGGVGSATAIFSIVNSLLLEPLPYHAADRLVFVWQDLTKAGYPRAPLAGPELEDLRQRGTLFTGVAGIWANTVALTDGPEPELLRSGLVTPDFFDVLGADAMLGRTFRPRDDAPKSPPLILLSHAVWKRRYSSDPRLVGTRILVNGRPTTVIGIMPESFALLLPQDAAIPDDQQAWVLLGRDALKSPRQQQFLRVVGRMKPGVQLADAQKEVDGIGEQVGREFSEYGRDGAKFYAVGLQADATREIRPALLGLFAAVCLLLLIACVNVAGLLITRATARHHDTAVRIAVGASRLRLFRQCLAEGLILSVIGGGVGLLLARTMLAALVSVRPPALARIDATVLDLRVFSFAALLAIVWGVLFALAPLTQLFRTTVLSVLRSGGRGPAGPAGYRVRSGLVVFQVAISGVLLITSGLLAKGFYELQRAKYGFNPEHVVTFKLSLAGSRLRGAAPIAAFSSELRRKLAAIPGVTAVGATSHLPFDTVPNWGSPYLPAHEPDETRAGLADARSITPGYFNAVEAELVEGRWFTDADAYNSLPVTIVDTVLASRLWPTDSAIGKQVKAGPATTGRADVTLTVVGVVRHIRHREVTRDLREQIYFPAPQSLRNPMAYVIRSATEGSDVIASVRSIIAELDPTLPIYDVRPLESYAAHARAMRGFTMILAIAFAVSALALATIGIYGVTAYNAAQRRSEFGLRYALGAQPRHVAGLVLRNAVRLAVIGAAIGCFGASVAAQLIRLQLYHVGPNYLPAYVVGAVTVLVAAVLAAWIPAWRAARISPLESLRGS